MPRMTGGQALAKSLYREGVRVIFGLPGVQLYHAVDAIAQEPGIRFITTRHEQATAYMADGYARASGEVGTAMVVPDPGLLNASAAIGTAYAASSPTLIVAGQVQRDMIGVNRGCFGASGAPWVGAKESGYGFHSSVAGHRQFAQTRVVSRGK